MNVYDWIIIAVLAAAVVLAVRKMIRTRGRSCGCGCENCPGCGKVKR